MRAGIFRDIITVMFHVLFNHSPPKALSSYYSHSTDEEPYLLAAKRTCTLYWLLHVFNFLANIAHPLRCCKRGKTKIMGELSKTLAWIKESDPGKD